jgi:hypothetical protein
MRRRQRGVRGNRKAGEAVEAVLYIYAKRDHV